MGQTRTTKPLSIQALRSKYLNDDAHTDHVTSLALRIFDFISSHFKLDTNDRPILEAAARLHDLGYSVSPNNHRQVGADLVRRKGLEGFSKDERESVAVVMLLHSGEPDSPHPSERLMRLGAILRLADGLDYGHIQDASIRGLEFSRERIRLHILAPHFPANILRARKKADLWEEAFHIPIDIVQAKEDDKETPPLISPDLTVAEAARRLLAQQFRTVVANTPAALSSENTEPLHDIRVALRRFAVLARTFRKGVDETTLDQVDRSLRHLNKALGPARDRDVLIEFLKNLPRELRAQHSLSEVLKHHETLRRQLQSLLHKCLDEPAFPMLKAETGMLLRIHLPRAGERQKTELLQIVTQSLRKRLKKALGLKKLRHAKSPERIHRLRITIRKARYLADAFGPLLGSPMLKLARRARAAEQVLGRVHDTDVFQHRLLSEGPTPPRALIKHLDRCHRDCRNKLNKAWNRFEKAACSKEVSRLLK